ncbi:MAG: signal peptidase I, partial [Erysipelotrichaceae bacterium]|nr:signal peptidase I [Erysipelotrichaceae bacterium]
KETIKDKLAVVIVWLMLRWDDIKDTIWTVFITCVVCLMITTWFFKPVIVKGTSMHPEVHDKSIGFSSIIAKNLQEIQRFDIVVIDLDSKEENLIKRVIGLPNETIRYENSKLYVNGQLVEEPFLDSEYVAQQVKKTTDGLFTKNFTYILGEDEYFCLGDNRLVSMDSRYYGPFRRDNILSKGVFVLYPFADFGAAR